MAHKRRRHVTTSLVGTANRAAWELTYNLAPSPSVFVCSVQGIFGWGRPKMQSAASSMQAK